MPDLLGGRVPMYIAATPELIEQHRTGRIRIISTTGLRRSALLPDVPTFTEQGLNIVAPLWAGVYAPARTPDDVAERLNRAIVSSVKRSRSQRTHSGDRLPADRNKQRRASPRFRRRTSTSGLRSSRLPATRRPNDFVCKGDLGVHRMTIRGTETSMDADDAGQTLHQLINGYRISQAIHVAASLQIADHLAGGPRTSQDLAATTATHPDALYRLLRALGGRRCPSRGPRSRRSR